MGQNILRFLRSTFHFDPRWVQNRTGWIHRKSQRGITVNVEALEVHKERWLCNHAVYQPDEPGEISTFMVGIDSNTE